MSEYNANQNPGGPYTDKYQKVFLLVMAVLVCVDYKFSKPFKTYLIENAVYNFLNSITKESKYWSERMKKI